MTNPKKQHFDPCPTCPQAETGKKAGYSAEAGLFSEQETLQPAERTLLLHSCCGPCSTACIERLLPDYRVTIFFFNPNITNEAEYEKRKAAQLQFLESYNLTLPEEKRVRFLEGDYQPERFFTAVRGYEDEPEGGQRCTLCFQLRLMETAVRAKAEGYRYFGTTLTVSPHKSYPLIRAIGGGLAQIYGVEFLDMDFKKKAGFQRSIELSKKYGLYRQNYCGCWFSERE